MDSGFVCHQELVADSVTLALEAQATNMENTDNTTRPRKAPIARYDVGYGTLTKEALSWWNSLSPTFGIEEDYQINLGLDEMIEQRSEMRTLVLPKSNMGTFEGVIGIGGLDEKGYSEYVSKSMIVCRFKVEHQSAIWLAPATRLRMEMEGIAMEFCD
ncbi:hypothetical protein Tco_1182199 [Tanacetum coccineum]